MLFQVLRPLDYVADRTIWIDEVDLLTREPQVIDRQDDGNSELCYDLQERNGQTLEVLHMVAKVERVNAR